MHAENLGRILLDKTRNSGAENYGILIRLSADWMGKVDYESEIFLIQRYITLWKGTTASVDIISLSSKLFHDSCFKPAERRKYFFRYSVYVGENSFDLKQVAIISACIYNVNARFWVCRYIDLRYVSYVWEVIKHKISDRGIQCGVWMESLCGLPLGGMGFSIEMMWYTCYSLV